jgi:hypothetical protein
MGAVVSIPARTVPVGVTKHLIIDGQQRLTTIAILLCALRDSMDAKAAARIQDYLVNRHYEGTPDYLKLVPTQGDREEYLHLVQKNPGDRKLHGMYEAYHHFRDSLRDFDHNGESVNHLRVLETVAQCLQVVMINLGEADDPYLIFESLNYKGEPLTQADLVRNYVLMRFRHSLEAGGEQQKIYERFWRPLESSLGENLSEFLRHYASKDSSDVKKPKIYAAIKSRFVELKTPDSVEAEIETLSRHGDYYKRFLDPTLESDARIAKQLGALGKMEVSISYPLLLRLFEAHRHKKQISDEALVQCLEMIESLIVRRTVCDEKRSALNRVFIRLAVRFPENEDIAKWLETEMLKTVRSERWPDDDEFNRALQEEPLYGTKGVKLVLEGLEEFYADKEVIDLSKVTIEHIMPQELTNEWREMLGSNCAEIHKRYLHTIGNLTLTGYNSELSNLSFKEKKKRYAESGIALNRTIAREPIWGVEQIERRAQVLANAARLVWKHPLSK